MKIFLCDGGSGKKIKEATIKFGSLIDKSKPLLYIPLAMKREKYDSCLEWIKEEMNIIGINNIDMVTSGEDLYKKNFDNYSAIYIGLCHYNYNIVKTENNINYLKKYSIGRKVIYSPEEDTIFIDSNDIELIGDKEYIVFNNGNMQVITVTENNR